MPDCDGTGTAERSYPASEFRGCGGEEIPYAPKPEARGGSREEQPTPEARGSDERSYPASEVRGGGQEEISHAPSQRPGAQEELPHGPMPKAKGGGREDQPHVQGALAARAQEGLEELSHDEGQEGRR